jgi:ribosomal protein S6--L-glutamate ligase
MEKVIALEARLKACSNVETLGVLPNFSDYSPEHRELIRSSNKIYYPSRLYAELFDAGRKQTFPNVHNYTCAQDKIKQTVLFNFLNIPHPRTRVFYGKRQKSKIHQLYSFPFIAKIPRGSAMGRGVFLIQNHEALQAYLGLDTPAYIQEYLPVNRDMRILVIGKKIVHAYWRIAAPGEFRSNVAKGARISFQNIPRAALDLALHTALSCQWNDVGIDICEYDNTFYVLEGNMKYGREGFRMAGIDYIAMMEKMIAKGDI